MRREKADGRGRARLFPLLLKLPSRLIVGSVVEELARVAVAAVPSVLEVLADVGLVVEARGRAIMHRCARRPMSVEHLPS